MRGDRGGRCQTDFSRMRTEFRADVGNFSRHIEPRSHRRRKHVLRAYRFLYPYTMETLRQEAIARSVDACRVVPSQLQEKIGDYAAIVASPLIRK